MAYVSVIKPLFLTPSTLSSQCRLHFVQYAHISNYKACDFLPIIYDHEFVIYVFVFFYKISILCIYTNITTRKYFMIIFFLIELYVKCQIHKSCHSMVTFFSQFFNFSVLFTTENKNYYI